jgi:hypothetical protein
MEAIETLRAWYLQDQQNKDRAEKDIRLKEEQEVIFKTIGVVAERWLRILARFEFGYEQVGLA